MPPESLKVELIDSGAKLAALMPEWRELLAGADTPSAFLSPAWLGSWWQIYGNGCQLWTLACRRDDGRLVGLFPGFLRSQNGRKILSFLGSRFAGSDFLDIIALPDYADAVRQTAFNEIDRQENWHKVELTDLPVSSPLFDSISIDWPTRFIVRPAAPKTICPAIDLPPDWESYLGRLKNKFAWKVLYERRNLQRHFQVELQGVQSLADLTESYPDMVRLHQERRQALGEPGLFCDPHYSAFFSKACQELLAEGRLRLTFLCLNKEKAAFFLAFDSGRRLDFYQSGFDRRFEKFSPGSVLLGMMIEAAISSGYDSFEFLRGDEPYKKNWATHRRETRMLTLYRSSPGGRLQNRADCLLLAGKAFARQIMPRRAL